MAEPPSSSPPPPARPRARQPASSSTLSPKASEALAAASAALDAFDAGAETYASAADDIHAAPALDIATPEDAASPSQGRSSIVGLMLALMLAGALTAWIYRDPLLRLMEKWF